MTISSQTVESEIEKIFYTVDTTSVKNTQKIYRGKPNDNFTVLPNDMLRYHVKGDPITAKDIWLHSQTCSATWMLTTKSIAKKFKISEKKAQRLCTRLCDDGLAERQISRDGKSGKFGVQFYIFFAQPVDKKCSAVKIEQQSEIIQESLETSGEQKSFTGDLLIEKQQRSKATTSATPQISDPQPEHPPHENQTQPLACLDIFKQLKLRVDEPLRSDFSMKTYKDLKALGLTDGQIKTVIDVTNKEKPNGCGWMSWWVKSKNIKEIEDLDIIFQKIKQTKLDNIIDEKERNAHIEKSAQQEASGISEIESMALSDDEKADLIRAYAMTKPVAMIKKWAKKSWHEVVGNMKFQDFVKERLTIEIC